MSLNFREKLIRLGIVRGTAPLEVVKNWVFTDDDVGEVSMVRVGDESVFYSTTEGMVVGLSPGENSATVEWSNTYHDGEDIRSLDAENGRLYFSNSFGGSDAVIQSVDQSDGSAVWSYSMDEYGAGTVVATQDRVFYADSFGESMGALSESDGSELWEISVSRSYIGGGSVGDGRLYTGDDNGFVMAHDQSDGSKLWEFERTVEGQNNPKLIAARYGDGRVYVPTQYGSVFVLDATDGSLLYEHDFHPNGSFVASAQLSEGFIYSCGDTKVICASDEDPPEKLWEHEYHTDARGIFSLDSDGLVVYSGGGTDGFDGEPEVVSASTSI